MKIRNGFVSNSSSTSFLVVFDKKPETIEELKELINLNKISSYEHSFVLSSILMDINEQVDKKTSLLEKLCVTYELGSYWDEENCFSNFFEEFPFNCIPADKINEVFKFADKNLIQKHFPELSDAFFDENKIIIHFRYCDEGGGIYCDMENGDLFNKLNYIKESHH